MVYRVKKYQELEDSTAVYVRSTYTVLPQSLHVNQVVCVFGVCPWLLGMLCACHVHVVCVLCVVCCVCTNMCASCCDNMRMACMHYTCSM